jgi:hypothetical protein
MMAKAIRIWMLVIQDFVMERITFPENFPEKSKVNHYKPQPKR